MAAPAPKRTLVVPAVAVGNVGQLAVDVLVANCAPLGGAAPPALRLATEHVEPVATADAMAAATVTGALSTAVEVFPLDAAGRVAALQLRSLVLPGHSRALARELVAWACANGYERLLVLGGAYVADAPPEAREATRWVSDPRREAANPDLLALTFAAAAAVTAADPAARRPAVAPLERGLAELEFTGLLKPLVEACVEAGADASGAPRVGVDALVRFVLEGDNRADGLEVASAAIRALGLTPARGGAAGGVADPLSAAPSADGLATPFSWRVVSGW